MRETIRRSVASGSRFVGKFTPGFWVASVIMSGTVGGLALFMPKFRDSLYTAAMSPQIYSNALTPFVCIAGFVGGAWLRGKREPVILCGEVLAAYLIGGAVAGHQDVPGAVVVFVITALLYAGYAAGSIILGWTARFLYRGIDRMLGEDELRK